MKPARLLLFTALHAGAALAAAEDPPADIMRFVEPGTELLSVHAADLNGDGTQDYLLVLQRGDTQRTRPLLIIGREKNGGLKLLKRNEQVVACGECGGMMGDPLQSLALTGQGFTVETAGGSIDRWANSFTFAYSSKDKTWNLARAQVSTYSAPDPDSFVKKVYLPPRDFGTIDIARFDPHQYLYPAPAQTLCREDETDHFSCTAMGSKKIISICSNIGQGHIEDDSWLQYRFGQPGKIELAFPQEKQGSLAKFEGHYFNPREQPMEIADLRFAAPGALYGVSLERDSSKKGEEGRYTGGVDVNLSRTKRVAIHCGKVDGARYFDSFVELNRTLPQSDSKTDMLQRFYREAAR
jgi:hypothetical protein